MGDEYKELKEGVALGLSAGELVAGLMDGIDIGDANKLMEVVKRAPAGIKDITKVKDAFPLTAEQKTELKKFVEEDFDIEADNIENVVELALKVAIDVSDLITIFTKKS